jgi:hypothetical protein
VPCHFLSKPGHVSQVLGQMLHESKRNGVSGTSQGTRETEVKLFLSLRLTQTRCRTSQLTKAIASHSSVPMAATHEHVCFALPSTYL